MRKLIYFLPLTNFENKKYIYFAFFVSNNLENQIFFVYLHRDLENKNKLLLKLKILKL